MIFRKLSKPERDRLSIACGLALGCACTLLWRHDMRGWYVLAAAALAIAFRIKAGEQ